MKKIFIIFLLFTACSPNSMEDFQYEGEAICRDLTQELKKIQTREELAKAVPKLKGKFEALVDLMIEARQFQEIAEEEWTPLATESNDALLVELKRIYKLEAGRETIEKAQSEALLRLDAFERSLQKNRGRLQNSTAVKR
jgi:hypothetical protein